ncbi:hypothetical protein GE09DRAFT_594943 [Coniochaeta sp. 2T2.1]|nr:hypothetical protein GE09DRAFT_594943 [Coniochaeta sp. 2T2.1]
MRLWHAFLLLRVLACCMRGRVRRWWVRVGQRRSRASPFEGSPRRLLAKPQMRRAGAGVEAVDAISVIKIRRG